MVLGAEYNAAGFCGEEEGRVRFLSTLSDIFVDLDNVRYTIAH